jgi:uracil-DNA glycosylase
MTDIQLEQGWKHALDEEFQKPYMNQLRQFLLSEKQQGKQIYPKGSLIFNALNSTPLDKVKVVILGQDPYHGENQAHGLCFSVNKTVAIPPSLRNIYKELHQDLGIQIPKHGNLQKWADQGVLLLNSVLTVVESQAASHQGKGWEVFTDRIISILNHKFNNIVYFLWGSYAQKKGINIDPSKNLILSSVHPSPLSAHRGFFGCNHFSKCNNYLSQHNKSIIDWQID